MDELYDQIKKEIEKFGQNVSMAEQGLETKDVPKTAYYISECHSNIVTLKTKVSLYVLGIKEKKIITSYDRLSEFDRINEFVSRLDNVVESFSRYM